FWMPITPPTGSKLHAETHPETGRMHAAADPEQLQPRSGGLRTLHGLRHHADRGGDHGARLLRDRTEPGLYRRRHRTLAVVHRRRGPAGGNRRNLRRPQGEAARGMNAPLLSGWIEHWSLARLRSDDRVWGK